MRPRPSWKWRGSGPAAVMKRNLFIQLPAAFAASTANSRPKPAPWPDCKATSLTSLPAQTGPAGQLRNWSTPPAATVPSKIQAGSHFVTAADPIPDNQCGALDRIHGRSAVH
jgi:hypothetical protein